MFHAYIIAPLGLGCKHLFDVDLQELAEACGDVGAREKLFKPFDQLGLEVLFFVLHVYIVSEFDACVKPVLYVFLII